MRTNFYWLAVPFGAMLSGACAPPPPTVDVAAEREALRKACDTYHEMAQSLNFSTIPDLYHQDAVILPPNAPEERGLEGVQRFATAFSSMPGLQIRFSNPTVEVSAGGDMGYSLADAELTVTGPDGQPVQDKARDFHLWRKDASGSWKVAVDIWNSELPLPTAGH